MGKGSAQRDWVGVYRTGRVLTSLRADTGEKKHSGHKMGCREGKNARQLSGLIA